MKDEAPHILSDEEEALLRKFALDLRERAKADGMTIKGVAVIVLAADTASTVLHGCDCFFCQGRIVDAMSSAFAAARTADQPGPAVH